MPEREIYQSLSGRIDIYEETERGGVSYDNINQAHIRLNTKKIAAGTGSVVLFSLAARAFNLSRHDLTSGFKQRDKIKFSMGVAKLGTAGALGVIGGILGTVSHTAGKRLEDLKKAA